MLRSILALLIGLLVADNALSLEPKDVFIIANKDMKESLDVASHYCKLRKVPRENVILLSLPKMEDISRADYDVKLTEPLRKALAKHKDDCKVLLTVYGVPLRVGPQDPTPEVAAKIAEIKPELENARKRLAELENAKPKDTNAIAEQKKIFNDWNIKLRSIPNDQSTAAVDSELMLLWWPQYELARWVFNPLYWQLPEEEREKNPPVLLTARLDGPTPEIAKRLVDDALKAEKDGLVGKAYIDARGQKFDVTKKNQWLGYEGYDESFRETAALLGEAGFDVVLDDKDPVFAAKTCPDAALYAGWYSHAKFVDSCTFATGAVAWHLASSEATSLRRKDTQVWCPNLLKARVAATMGPVAEPYTVGFPKPAEFFGFFLSGEYTLVECFAKTTILTSWQMTLVGDPLYNPFKSSPKWKIADVVPSPKGSKIKE
jgi:uncharacterized protein (TIGR03790 family)